MAIGLGSAPLAPWTLNVALRYVGVLITRGEAWRVLPTTRSGAHYRRPADPIRELPHSGTSRTPRSVGESQPTVEMRCHLYSRPVSYSVDFVNVSTVGLESSPVTALAGLRANEARYFKNKYDHVFTVEPATRAKKAIGMMHRILKEERGIVIVPPRSRRRRSRSRTSAGPTCSTRAGCRSTSCTRSTDRIRSGRSGSSSPKGWTSPPSWARSSSHARNRSLPGPSEARTS